MGNLDIVAQHLKPASYVLITLCYMLHHRVCRDTFSLKVPRWLYDYFSLGVFIIH